MGRSAASVPEAEISIESLSALGVISILLPAIIVSVSPTCSASIAVPPTDIIRNASAVAVIVIAPYAIFIARINILL